MVVNIYKYLLKDKTYVYKLFEEVSEGANGNWIMKNKLIQRTTGNGVFYIEDIRQILTCKQFTDFINKDYYCFIIDKLPEFCIKEAKNVK